MKESIGYTVTINIIIIFITIVFTFLVSALIYYKSNKIGNIIARSLEKYEGYNTLAKNEIDANMETFGYSSVKISCSDTVGDRNATDGNCNVIDKEYSSSRGYCVYECANGEYYYYKIKTNMMIDFPIIHDILSIPIYTSTNMMFVFEGSESGT